jgi:hypothetical protein
MVTDDDEPPPLAPPPKPARLVDPPPPLDDGPRAKPRAPAAAPARASGSMGLKKGFLTSGGASKPRARPAAAAKPELEMIRPANPQPAGASRLDAKLAGLRLDEVQKSLQGASEKLASDTTWVTDGLLSKMQSDPILAQGLTNPRFSAVMAEMQTDPQGAMERHKGDGELQAFMLRFMQLMASHFTDLAPQQQHSGSQPGTTQQRNGGGEIRVTDSEVAAIAPALSAEDRAAEALAHKALSDPQLRAVLEDPDVQRVLQHVQARNMAPVEGLIRRPDMVTKLQRLAKAGLLQMSWAP